MTDHHTPWDDTYTAKLETEVSWYQAHPDRSLEIIKSAFPQPASIIDVGGGASRLADALLAEGYADLTVLDISEVALGRSKARLGALSDWISWIVADITQWQPQRTWNVWHDRAVFHFLIDARCLYRSTKEGHYSWICRDYGDLRADRSRKVQRPSRPAIQSGHLGRTART